MQSCARLSSQLQQDNYRLATALDGLRRRLREDTPASKKGKTASVLPPASRSIGEKRRKKGRASSNPLEYVEHVELSQVVLTTKGDRAESSEQEDEESIEEFEEEMPSMINKNDADEFLQGDSFLMDALSLQQRS